MLIFIFSIKDTLRVSFVSNKAKSYFDSRNIETKLIHLNEFLPSSPIDDLKEKHELHIARTVQDRFDGVLQQ